MKLNELGLIFNDGSISVTVTIEKEPCVSVYNRHLIMLIGSVSGNKEKVNIGQYPFTEAGKEIATLINETASGEDFLRYGEILVRNKPYEISVHKVIKLEDDTVEYDKTNLMPQGKTLTD